jgi:hypothetical protein
VLRGNKTCGPNKNRQKKEYGEITDSVIMKDRKIGQSRGYGFVAYSDPSAVDQVIQDTLIINGKQVRF